MDLDLERLRWQCCELATGQNELFDVMLHFVEHRVGQRRRRQRAPCDLGLLAVVPAGPAEPGPEDPLGDSPLGQRVRHDRNGVLVFAGAVPQRHPEAFPQEELDRIAQEAIQQVDVDGPDLALQGVGQERPEVAVLVELGAGPFEVELVKAPGPGGDELTRHEIPWVEGLQRVLHDDGVAGPSRRRANRVVHHVEELAHRDRRRAGLVRALVVPAVGDDQVLAGGQQGVE